MLFETWYIIRLRRLTFNGKQLLPVMRRYWKCLGVFWVFFLKGFYVRFKTSLLVARGLRWLRCNGQLSTGSSQSFSIWICKHIELLLPLSPLSQTLANYQFFYVWESSMASQQMSISDLVCSGLITGASLSLNILAIPRPSSSWINFNGWGSQSRRTEDLMFGEESV